jgi:hypothetical protein
MKYLFAPASLSDAFVGLFTNEDAIGVKLKCPGVGFI